jgi:hypothetical protein
VAVPQRYNSGALLCQGVLAVIRCRCLSILQFDIQILKIKMYRTIILPVVLYGNETWSPTLREERRLRVFENRVLRRIFWLKRDKVTGVVGSCIMRKFMICTPRPILFGR